MGAAPERLAHLSGEGKNMRNTWIRGVPRGGLPVLEDGSAHHLTLVASLHSPGRAHRSRGGRHLRRDRRCRPNSAPDRRPSGHGAGPPGCGRPEGAPDPRPVSFQRLDGGHGTAGGCQSGTSHARDRRHVAGATSRCHGSLLLCRRCATFPFVARRRVPRGLPVAFRAQGVPLPRGRSRRMHLRRASEWNACS